MHIALIGAGFVGAAVLDELLNRGHQVTLLARTSQKITRQDANLTVVTADVYQSEQVANGVRGTDAVINAFNAGWTNPNLYADFLKGSQAIQQGVKAAGVPRLLVVGGAGSLYIGDSQLVDSPDFPADFKVGATAARDYLNLLKTETTLDWTFLSPAIEMHPGTSGERRGTYRTGLEQPVFDAEGRSVLSVEDLAVVIVDEIEQPTHSRQRFTAAY